MATASQPTPPLRQLEPQRTASICIRLVAAVSLADGLPTDDDSARLQFDLLLDTVHTMALRVRAEGAPDIASTVATILARGWAGLGSFDFHPGVREQASRAKAGLDSIARGFSDDLQGSLALPEFRQMFASIDRRVRRAYGYMARRMGLELPSIWLEFSSFHEHRTTDSLGFAVTGATRLADGPAPRSIVTLAIQDEQFDWATLGEMPYVIAHELMCHAYQGLTLPGRKTVDPSCAWSEGWMDLLALLFTERWTVRDSATFTNFGPFFSDSVRRQAQRVNARRYDPQDFLRPSGLAFRQGTKNAFYILKRDLKGNGPEYGGIPRLVRFSIRLNLETLAQQQRKEILQLLADSLLMFKEGRRVAVVGAINRYADEGDLALLVGDIDRIGRSSNIFV